MKITVIGTGYVGLSLSVLLSQHHEVIALDILEEKVNKINKRISPIEDREIKQYFKIKDLNLRATLNQKEAIKNADMIIISTPTNYDSDKDYFDTSTIENSIELILKYNLNAFIIIKSTIPVGYTEEIKKRYNIKNIVFSPEFLREGHALYDNLYPTRIIIGSHDENSVIFANALKKCSLKKEVPILFTGNTEAEAIKLFANTYLAMRVSFFNELDTYAEMRNLNTKDIIEGVCFDNRIGNHYNNPSFGYGGYCLPKDTKQLKANYKNVPENLISAIVLSNSTRKDHITEMILARKPKVVGIYRLTMKTGSDNFRASAIQGIMNRLSNNNVEIIIYEPTLIEKTYNTYKVINDLDLFKMMSDTVIANRITSEISDIKEKIYTRDLYERD